MDEDGWFSIVDRKKDLIITGWGEHLSSRGGRSDLRAPKGKEVAVVGVPHPFGGEIAKAFVVLKPGETATKKDITQFAGERLAKHKVPRSVEFRDELPKSGAQKVCAVYWRKKNALARQAVLRAEIAVSTRRRR